MRIIECSVPLTQQDLVADHFSKYLYYIDYSKSTLKGKDFLNYVTNLGVVCDVNLINVEYEDREQIILEYMNFSEFLGIHKFNNFIMNCLLLSQDIHTTVGEDDFHIVDRKHFISRNINKIKEWKCWLDSYIVYSICYALTDKPSQTVDNSFIGKTVVSTVLSDGFYDIYAKLNKIDKNNIYYFKKYHEELTYDGHPFNNILLNDKNIFIKVLNSIITDKQFRDFLSKRDS